MPHFTVRAAAAALAFALGLGAVRLAGLASSLEAAARWLVPTPDVSVPAVRAEDDAQKVYETVLRELFDGGDPSRLLIVRAETDDCTFVDDEIWATDFEGIERETLADYNSRLGRSTRLPDLTGVGARYVLIQSCARDSMLHDPERGVWEVFYQKFPGASGYIRLSAIGFNRVGDQAFLYAAMNCGGLCGEGWQVLLRKTGGGWEIENKRLVWIS